MSLKINEQIDRFIANIKSFLEETIDIMDSTYKLYPELKKQISIDSDLVSGIIQLINFFDINSKQKIVTDFVEKSYPFWDEIYNQDRDFLVNHVISIFPDNEYVKDVSFFFGNNVSKKIYIDDEETLDYLWKLLKGMVTLSIKFMHYSKWNNEINVNDEIKKWNVNV